MGIQVESHRQKNVFLKQIDFFRLLSTIFFFIYYIISQKGDKMFTLLLSSLILNTAPSTPTEIIGSAATPTGGRHEITAIQPQNTPDSFGYIAPEEITSHEQNQNTTQPQQAAPTQTATQTPVLITNQFATVNPTNMNPLDYKDKIENTIYQSGNRLIIIQSIPIKYIKQTTEPNIQPTINTFPSF